MLYAHLSLNRTLREAPTYIVALGVFLYRSSLGAFFIFIFKKCSVLSLPSSWRHFKREKRRRKESVTFTLLREASARFPLQGDLFISLYFQTASLLRNRQRNGS